MNVVFQLALRKTRAKVGTGLKPAFGLLINWNGIVLCSSECLLCLKDVLQLLWRVENDRAKFESALLVVLLALLEVD